MIKTYKYFSNRVGKFYGSVGERGSDGTGIPGSMNNPNSNRDTNKRHSGWEILKKSNHIVRLIIKCKIAVFKKDILTQITDNKHHQ